MARKPVNSDVYLKVSKRGVRVHTNLNFDLISGLTDPIGIISGILGMTSKPLKSKTIAKKGAVKCQQKQLQKKR